MACNDTVIFPFLGIPDGSTYELKVTCPPGAAATAVFTDTNQPPPKQWTQDDLSLGKQQVVHTPGPDSVVTSIAFGSAAPVTVKVEGKVTTPAGAVLKSYCREISGANGQTEVIVHTLHMA